VSAGTSARARTRARGPGLRLHRYSCWFCYLQRHEARRPPAEARTPACSSAGNRGSVLATRPAGACRDRRTRRPKRRPRRRRRRRRRRRVSPWGYSAQCWGGGVTTAASAASAASALLPLPPLLCCPGMRVRATLTATKRRGLPAGSAAKATCLESLLAQPPLASLPAGGLGTTHALRTTHCTAHCLVGGFSASWSRRPKSSSRRWRCWRCWRRWSRSPCHGGRAGVTYSRAAASWAMLDHCWTMPRVVVNPVPAAQTVRARWLATGW
jgi:hypothetical protein